MEHLDLYKLFCEDFETKKQKKKRKQEEKRKAEELRAKTEFVPKILKSLPLMTPEDNRRILSKNNLFKLADKIYALKIADEHLRSFIFMRVQEFYESQNPKFFQNDYQIADFIKWYKEDFKKSKYFTYGTDWGGFNIPSEAINTCLKGLKEDPNDYDKMLMAIVDTIKKDEDGRFYLIGTDLSDGGLLDHEMAHGLYYTNLDYRKQIDSIITRMTPSMHKKVADSLLDMGYNQRVIDDEIQAYIATGGGNSYYRLVDEEPFKYKPSKYDDRDKYNKILGGYGGYGGYSGYGGKYGRDFSEFGTPDEYGDVVIGSNIGKQKGKELDETEYLEDECPHCQHKFKFEDYTKGEDVDEIKCPKCHKDIELVWVNDKDEIEDFEDECPYCQFQFNYKDVTEAGMGYIRCPGCDRVITQKDLEEYKKLGEGEDFEPTNTIQDERYMAKGIFDFFGKNRKDKKKKEEKEKKIYSSPEDVQLAKKICQDLCDTFDEYFEEVGEPEKVEVDYSKYFKI